MNQNFLQSPATVPAQPAICNRQAASAPLAGRVDSSELLRGSRAVEICHNGTTYRLQSTRQGKLILTK